MKIKLTSPFDAHLHLRDGQMLENVLPATTAQFSGAIVMPNLQPPLTEREDILAYRDRILSLCQEAFHPAMTLFLTPEHTPKSIEAVRDVISAVKLYPAGATTNSEAGVHSLLDNPRFLEVLEAMEAMDIPLSVHGETGDFVLDREAAFGPTYAALAAQFPKLRIVMEHVGSAALLPLLDQHENLHATITLHHLLLTLDDLIGGSLAPHLFCKPAIKCPDDRRAIQKAVLSEHSKIFFGSDSAPHPQHAKISPKGAAGIFSAPVLLPALATFFEQHDALGGLEGFVAQRGARFYGLTLPKREVCLEKTPWQVPEIYGDVVPMFAGRELPWKIAQSA